MDRQGNLYSHFVAGLKVLLPLGALALLSTMFLFANGPGPDPAIPFAEIEAIAIDPRVGDPHFAGIADDGSVISIIANEIRPDAGQKDAFSIDAIRATIDATDGSRIEITAGQGQLEPRNKIARLTGLARVSTSSGYVLETAGLVADLNSGTVTSIGALEAQAPYGDFSAGGLVISNSRSGEGSQMVFNGGVHLLYKPQP
jgi:lipopolysaccharide export system protein LptC